MVPKYGTSYQNMVHNFFHVSKQILYCEQDVNNESYFIKSEYIIAPLLLLSAPPLMPPIGPPWKKESFL